MKEKIKDLKLVKYTNLLMAYNTLKNDYTVLESDFEELAIASSKNVLETNKKIEYYKGKYKLANKRIKKLKEQMVDVK